MHKFYANCIQLHVIYIRMIIKNLNTVAICKNFMVDFTLWLFADDTTRKGTMP